MPLASAVSVPFATDGSPVRQFMATERLLTTHCSRSCVRKRTLSNG